ncbi:DUF2393 domain-containing protein [Helicobacter aurati]|uniref:DUF2393 domain-containing protein n=1 Tax=Helicobacter aurati TaxID=137778 RepID=A0A3D8J7B7_9HELI|nr:DUF2393 family protein [Helicobacter aurati]RDU73318.1 DUF2393 domain-containing protein [Helicobacter aurati]
MKEKLIEFLSYLNVYDLILFAALLILGLCLIFLSFIAFRHKIISIPLFFIGFSAIVCLPFIMRYLMENIFYKINTEVHYDRVLRYSDIYKYSATITNIGKRNIAGCVISHRILYDTEDKPAITKYKNMLLNYIKPKKVYTKNIPINLKVNQSVDVSMQSQEFIQEYPYREQKHLTKIECYGKENTLKNVTPLEGKYLQKHHGTTDTNHDTEANNTLSDSKEANNIANTFNEHTGSIESEIKTKHTNSITAQGANSMTSESNNTSSINSPQDSEVQQQNSQEDFKQDPILTPQDMPDSQHKKEESEQDSSPIPTIPTQPDLKSMENIPLLKETPR